MGFVSTVALEGQERGDVRSLLRGQLRGRQPQPLGGEEQRAHGGQRQHPLVRRLTSAGAQDRRDRATLLTSVQGRSE
jgi:hypothetical protein